MSGPQGLRFLLFADGSSPVTAVASGVDRFLVDLESRGKCERQHGYHLECAPLQYADISRVKKESGRSVVCRVNGWHKGSPLEVERVLGAGADVLMLPMFRSEGEVCAFLKAVDGQAFTSLLFETPEAVALVEKLRTYPFDEAYVGLNDLSISYRLPFGFDLLRQGVVDRLRDALWKKPFGFGGLTLLGCGHPLATEHILSELARLECTDVILRRAFVRDVKNRDMSKELLRIQNLFSEYRVRSPEQIDLDRKLTWRKINDVVSDCLVESS